MANELSIRVSKTTVARLLAAMIAALFVLNVFAVMFEFVTDDLTGRDY
jgi:hypothetical protein